MAALRLAMVPDPQLTCIGVLAARQAATVVCSVRPDASAVWVLSGVLGLRSFSASLKKINEGLTRCPSRFLAPSWCALRLNLGIDIKKLRYINRFRTYQTAPEEGSSSTYF